MIPVTIDGEPENRGVTLSNRLNKKSSAGSTGTFSRTKVRTEPQKARRYTSTVPGEPPVPRIWIIGTMAVLGLLALIAAGISMWVILHRKLAP